MRTAGRRHGQGSRICGWILGLLVVMAALVVPGSASAVTWLPVQTLSAAGGEAREPQVSFDAGGNALVVWDRQGGDVRAQARFLPAGGVVGPIEGLSFPGTDTIRPQIGFDSAGNALTAWRRIDGATDRVQARDRFAGGGLGDLENLATGNVGDPRVAVDPAGNALVVYIHDDGADHRVNARYRPAGGSYGAAQILSAAGDPGTREQVAMDPAGNALVIWQRPTFGNNRIQARFRPDGGAFAATQNLSPAGGHSDGPHVAFDPAGNALAAWERNFLVQTRYRPAGGAFGATQTISSAAENANESQIALDPAGNALIAWYTFGGATDRIQARFRTPDGDLGPVQNLAADGDPEQPQVALDPAGNALVVWLQNDGANRRVQARYRPGGGSFGPVQNLSAAGGDADAPQVDFDAAGNALVVWQRYDGADDRVQARFLQGPQGGARPSNDFSFGKLKRNRKRGTAKQTVIVPGPGELDLARTKKVKPRSKRAEEAGKVKLRIKPKRRSKRRLNLRGKAKVKANVTYTPDGGDPRTKMKKVKLKKRRR
ncbi:MAG: hypothetical protein ACRDL3_10215 [Solirubrobacterales bacterium]